MTSGPAGLRLPAVLRAAALLFTWLAAPGLAKAAVPEARGGAELRLGLGGGSHGAPNLEMGAGLGLFDDGATRLDLSGRLGFGGGQDVKFDVPAVARGEAMVSVVDLLAEVSVARRWGRLEPWLGVGYFLAATSGTFDYTCYSEEAVGCAGPTPRDAVGTFDGSTVTGPTLAGGTRFALTDRLLLDGALRYRWGGRSHFDELPASVVVGGYSVLLSVIWRIEARPAWMAPPVVAGAPAAAPGPAPGPEPREPPALVEVTAAAPPVVSPAFGACAEGEATAFTAHVARRFRCYPDPVRGGHYCEPGRVEGEFVERSACEASCRGAEGPCPVGGTLGAACQRCVERCADTLPIACKADGDGPERSCRIEAGTFGLREDRVVPARCRAGARRTGGP